MRISRTQTVRMFVVSFFVFSFSSCNTSNPSQELQKELQTVVSWIETTRVTAEAWERGTVPSHYVERTFETAQETLQQEAETIHSLSLPEAAKAQAVASIQRLITSTGEANAAVMSNDHSRLASALPGLMSEEQLLTTTFNLKPVQSPTP